MNYTKKSIIILAVLIIAAMIMTAAVGYADSGYWCFHEYGQGGLCRNCGQPVTAVDERGVYYTSLQDALNAGGNIKLLTDVPAETEETLTVPAGVTVVLDLNGKEIGEPCTVDIVNYGTLTINDSSWDDENNIRGKVYGTIYTESYEHREYSYYDELTQQDVYNITDCAYGAKTVINSGLYYGDFVVRQSEGSGYTPEIGKENPTLVFNNGISCGGYFSLPDAERGNITVNGGRFTVEPTAKLIKSGYSAQYNNEDNYYHIEITRLVAGWENSQVLADMSLSSHARTVAVGNNSVNNFYTEDFGYVTVSEIMLANGISFNPETDRIVCTIKETAIAASEESIAGASSEVIGMSFSFSPFLRIYHGSESMEIPISWDIIEGWSTSVRIPCDSALATDRADLYCGDALKYSNVEIRTAENGDKYITAALSKGELEAGISYVTYEPTSTSIAKRTTVYGVQYGYSTLTAAMNSAESGDTVTVLGATMENVDNLRDGITLKIADSAVYTGTVSTLAEKHSVFYDEETKTYTLIRDFFDVTVIISGTGSGFIANTERQLENGEKTEVQRGGSFKADIFCDDGSRIEAVRVNGENASLSTILELADISEDKTVEVIFALKEETSGLVISFDSVTVGSDAVDRAKSNFANANVSAFSDTGLNEALDMDAVRAAAGLTSDSYNTVDISLRLCVKEIYTNGSCITGYLISAEPIAQVSSNGIINGEVAIPNGAIKGNVTFRIPIDALAFMDNAVIYHNGELMTYCTVQGNSPDRYVEVVTSSFSDFEIRNIIGTSNHPVAAIGSVGYAILSEALASAAEGDTVYVLDSTAGITVPDEINGVHIRDGFNVSGELLSLCLLPQYTITYDEASLDTGKNNPENITVYDDKTEFEFLPPVMEDHEFAGWYQKTAEGKYTKVETTKDITGNVTLYAKWYYHIKYEYNGGALTTGLTETLFYTGLEDVYVYSPAKQAASFDAWYRSDDFTGRLDQKTSTSGYVYYSVIKATDTPKDVTLYARWRYRIYVYTNRYGYATVDDAEITSGNYVDRYDGDVPVLRFIPYDGYRMFNLTVNGEKLGQVYTYTIYGLNANQTIVATFSRGYFNPLTGDDGRTGLYLTLMIVSGIMLPVCCGILRRRKQKSGPPANANR